MLSEMRPPTRPMEDTMTVPRLSRLAVFVLALLGLSAGAPARAQVLELTVVLRTLATTQINDGCGADPLCITTDRTAEAYGALTIDGVNVLWNDHRCESGCLVAGQYTTDIR